MTITPTTQVIIRGATVQFLTTFFDVNDNVVQPDSAFVNIMPSQATAATLVTMNSVGGGSVQWVALWDTRNVPAPQVVYWSIHTGTTDPIPVAAEDGFLQLAANPANLPTF